MTQTLIPGDPEVLWLPCYFHALAAVLSRLLLNLGTTAPSQAPVGHPGVNCILLHLRWEPAAVVHTNVS